MRKILILMLLCVVISCVPDSAETGINPWNRPKTTEKPEANISEAPEPQEPPVPVPEVPDELDYDIVLTAKQTSSTVILTWTEFTGDFQSYKVSRSVSDSNPQYPGHRLRVTIPYVDETTYTDTLPEPGISYYVVTALTPLNEKTHSNPVMVEFPSAETPDQEIILTAEKTDEGVKLSWTRYDGEFTYYKVVRTTKHPYPKYPDDDVITTIGFQNVTEYLDLRPEDGLNYYGVTIVRPDKSKFTSTRASVLI